MINKVEICGVDTAKLKVLPESEKRLLLEKIKNGDMKAREEFINGNLKLVLSVVSRFSNKGESADDLFQVGCIGLIKSIDNFDISQPVCFSTYAVPMIIGEIRRYLRDNNAIRVSRSLRDTAYKALTAREKLSREMNREPTVEEIAREMGTERSEVVLALDAIVDPVSLYEPVFSDDTDTIYVIDQVKNDSGGDSDWVDEICLRQAESQLTEREKSILSLRFFSGRTQVEVADEIGISQAQVSRLEKSAIDRIKKYM